MQLGKNKVGIIQYTLKDDNDEILDQSDENGFTYLHDAQNLIPGLERELDGKQKGDTLSVTVKPEDAYGERQLEAIQTVPRELFPSDQELEVGMSFHGEAEDGHPMIVTVTAVEADKVTIDGNHPLAGQTLHFDVAILDVRDATEEELTHGHVHGHDGNEEH